MTNVKRIITKREEPAYQELQDLADDFGYKIHVKVRLADAFTIDGSRIDTDLYSFSLKSHFDFLICNDDEMPIFAVEFDDSSHQRPKQQARDSKKNEICRIFEFPLLRINANHLPRKYNKTSILRWIISAWELQKSFIEAQEKGQIPEDEDFDPIFLWHQGTTPEEIHPHWIGLKPRIHIEQLHAQGRIPFARTCGFTFFDSHGHYRGIEWIDVDNGKVVFIMTGMKAQLFPVDLHSLFTELMTVLLHEKLIKHLETGDQGVETSEVEKIFISMKQCYRYYGSHTGNTRVKYSLTFDRGRWV